MPGTVPTTAELQSQARAYYQLIDEAAELGVPTSLDDPRSPRTVLELADAVQAREGADDDVVVAWQQCTTGKLHRRQGCGVTSRTRYRHVRVELTRAEVADCDTCSRCWGQS